MTEQGGPAPRRGAAWMAAGYALLLLVLFHRLLLGEVLGSGAEMYLDAPFAAHRPASPAAYLHREHNDVWTQWAPFQRELHVGARQGPFGRLPQWNPHIYGGFAFLGNAQSAPFFPFNWLYALFEPDLVRGPAAMLRLGVSALALALLLRRHGLLPAAAFAGGLTWMLAAFNLRWLHWPHTNVTLWLPVVLLALDALIRGPSWRRWALAALVAAVLYLAGHPGTLYLATLVLGLYLLCAAGAQQGWRRGATALTLGALALLAGVLGAAVALLPFLYEMWSSVDWQQAQRGLVEPLPLEALWLFLAPDGLGRPRAWFTYFGPHAHTEVAPWFGLIGLALTLAAAPLALRRAPAGAAPNAEHNAPPRFLLLFALLLLVSGTLVAFTAGPVHDLLLKLPLGGLTSYRRMFLAANLAGAILAAIGFDRLCRGDRRIAVVVAALLALGVAGVVVLIVRQHLPGLSELGRGVPWRHASEHPSLRTLLGAAVGGAGVVVLGVALVQVRRGRAPGRVVVALLLGVIALDLLLPAYNLNPIAPRSMVDAPAPPILADLQHHAGEDRIVAAGRLLWPNLAMRYELRDVRGYDVPRPRRLVQVLEQAGFSWTEPARGAIGHLAPRTVRHGIPPEMAAVLDRFSVRFLLNAPAYLPPGDAPAAVPVLPDESGAVHGEPWPLVAQGSGMLIFENPNRLPRAYIPATVRTVSGSDVGSAAAAMQALLDPAIDLRRLSVVELPTEPHALAFPAEAAGQVDLLREQEERVELEVVTATGGLVVLADRTAPGWTVSVNDQPALALTANYLFRGVLVPPGTHRVVWEYRTPGLAPGAIISGAALGLLLLLLIAGSRRDPGLRLAPKRADAPFSGPPAP